MNSLHEILSGKNINFLIGSGASVPIFKTLSLGTGKCTLEELLASEEISSTNKHALYYYYYKNWISQMKSFDVTAATGDNRNTLENYYLFVKKVVEILESEGNERPKKANIFTTNYDLIFEYTFERILQEGKNSYFNDGSTGFVTRTLNPQNYNLSISQVGYNDNFKREVPTVNLQKMHGSVSWEKSDDELIVVSYDREYSDMPSITALDKHSFPDGVFVPNLYSGMSDYDSCLSTMTTGVANELAEFWKKYKHLAIINPDKWKFHQTVFEQHYYQLIRNFSYELEKENTVLVVFGFSFADEHILEIFKRSLCNPTLQVVLICYDAIQRGAFKKIFVNTNNIVYYPNDETGVDGFPVYGNFTYFNRLLNGDVNE